VAAVPNGLSLTPPHGTKLSVEVGLSAQMNAFRGNKVAEEYLHVHFTNPIINDTLTLMLKYLYCDI
jgi:hypothetical protein